MVPTVKMPGRGMVKMVSQGYTGHRQPVQLCIQFGQRTDGVDGEGMQQQLLDKGETTSEEEQQQ